MNVPGGEIGAFIVYIGLHGLRLRIASTDDAKRTLVQGWPSVAFVDQEITLDVLIIHDPRLSSADAVYLWQTQQRDRWHARMRYRGVT